MFVHNFPIDTPVALNNYAIRNHLYLRRENQTGKVIAVGNGGLSRWVIWSNRIKPQLHHVKHLAVVLDRCTIAPGCCAYTTKEDSYAMCRADCVYATLTTMRGATVTLTDYARSKKLGHLKHIDGVIVGESIDKKYYWICWSGQQHRVRILKEYVKIILPPTKSTKHPIDHIEIGHGFIEVLKDPKILVQLAKAKGITLLYTHVQGRKYAFIRTA